MNAPTETSGRAGGTPSEDGDASAPAERFPALAHRDRKDDEELIAAYRSVLDELTRRLDAPEEDDA